MDTKSVAIQPVGFQEEFIYYGLHPDPIDYLFLYAHAGRGAGKTSGGALRMLAYMGLNKGARGLITVPKYDTWVDSTFPAIREIMGWAGLREGKHWAYVENKKQFLFYMTGCEVFVRSTDNPTGLAGPTLAFVWMDEPRLTPEEAFSTVVPTMRQAGFPHQYWATSTPQGRSHWLFKIWYPEDYYFEHPEEERYVSPVGNYKAWAGVTGDNPRGGKELDELLRARYGGASPRYRQEALGEHVHAEGLVFEQWDKMRYVVPETSWLVPPKHLERMICGVDFGWTAPSAFLVGGIDGESRRYQVEEFYQTHLSDEQIGQVAVSLAKKHKQILYFSCDSAAPEKIAAINLALRKAGVRRCRAIGLAKSVGSVWDLTSGIGRCSETLDYRVDGLEDDRGYFVSPKCVYYTREMENYVRQEERAFTNPNEKPRPFADHLISAWRYQEAAYYKLGWLGSRPIRQPSKREVEIKYA